MLSPVCFPLGLPCHLVLAAPAPLLALGQRLALWLGKGVREASLAQQRASLDALVVKAASSWVPV